MKIERLGYALGAKVTGPRIAEGVGSAEVAQIRAAWLEHLVLCFPNQPLTKTQLLAFAEQFGNLEVARPRYVDPEDRNTEIITTAQINGKPRATHVAGYYWHTDESFTKHPTSAAFLNAQALPPAGGDTMWANMYAAYETLSPAMQRIAEQLEAIHAHPPSRREKLECPAIVQPLVRRHPETGRKALYLSLRDERITNFVGMTEEESAPLLDFFVQHAVRYENTYRHRWTVGDLIMWDNRCLMHIAFPDYDIHNEVRMMLRTAVAGEESGYEYRPETLVTAAS